MVLVRINRRTIKKNKDAGRTLSMIPLQRELKFITDKKVPPKFLKDNLCVLVEQNFESDKKPVSTYATTDSSIIKSLFDWAKKTAGDGLLQLEINQDYQRVDHEPIPEYSFRYCNPIVKCKHCQKKSRLSEIDDYDDEYNDGTICPKCGNHNSFGEIKYEKITDISIELLPS